MTNALHRQGAVGRNGLATGSFKGTRCNLTVLNQYSFIPEEQLKSTTLKILITSKSYMYLYIHVDVHVDATNCRQKFRWRGGPTRARGTSSSYYCQV